MQCRCECVSISKFKVDERVVNNLGRTGTIIKIKNKYIHVLYDDVGYSLIVEEKYLKLYKGENMTLNVNIKTNGKEEKEVNYQELVIDKIEQITRLVFEKGKGKILKGYFYNTDIFLSVAFLQVVTKGITYSFIDHKGLSLALQDGKTWQDVYNKIKDIDFIEYNLEV